MIQRQQPREAEGSGEDVCVRSVDGTNVPRPHSSGRATAASAKHDEAKVRRGDSAQTLCLNFIDCFHRGLRVLLWVEI